MITFNTKLAEVVARDPRFAYEAYEFVYQALDYALKSRENGNPARAGGESEATGHIAGGQMLEAIRTLALKEFGLMARAVFRQWGLSRTEDFGTIVFNLIQADLMSKSDGDSLDDFRDGFDFDVALLEGYDIPLDEAR